MGVAAVITASGSLVGSIAVLVQTIRIRTDQKINAVKLDVVQKHVNGMNEQIAKGARAEGVIEGLARASALPPTPAPAGILDRVADC